MDKPLSGKTVLVTRTTSQAKDLVDRLEASGAAVIHKPMIKITLDFAARNLTASFRQISKYDWIIFTSSNAVEIFFRLASDQKVHNKALSKVKCGTVGETTAKKLSTFGKKSHFQPQKYSAKYFSDEFKKKFGDLNGLKILFPCGDLAKSTIPEELTRAGAEVVKFPIYKTEAVNYSFDDLVNTIKDNHVDVVSFTSPSTVEAFMESIGDNGRKRFFEKFAVASIGPVTSDALREYDIDPEIEAGKSTIEGLVQSISNFYATK